MASESLVVCSGADAVAFNMNVQRPMGGARDGQHEQPDLCRAAHHRPTPTMCDPIENPSPTARSAPATLSATRMPNVAARAAAAWRPCRSHALTTGLATQQPETRVVPRGGGMRGGQPRCARGNRKGRPKAWTTMTTGQSGANAPDRNRGRPPRMPPPRGTTYEVPNAL